MEHDSAQLRKHRSGSTDYDHLISGQSHRVLQESTAARFLDRRLWDG